MTMPQNDVNVTTDRVLELAGQLSNGDSQPPQQGQGEGQDQRIPYERFKEVNDERKTYQEQNGKLMDLLEKYQTMQTQNVQQTQQSQQQQPAPQAQSIFTEDELNGFENDIIVDPKGTLQKFGEAILSRGVENRVKTLEASFEERLNKLSGQMSASAAPNIINSFTAQRFGQHQQAETAAFNEIVKTIDPSLLSNPATLENVRLAAIGYVADQRSNGNQPQNAPFSEQPGGGPQGGWGGLGGSQQAPQVPHQVIEAARKMGVDPKEAAAMYQAMNTSGVFRG